MLGNIGVRVKILKEAFDVIGDLPGVAAFVKVFFGDAGKKKLEERLLRDLRDELFEDIALLSEKHRRNLERRLRRAQAIGREDQLVWDICKIKREVRQKWALKWLNRISDREFDQYVALLRDDKLEQFITRVMQRYREQLLPLVAQLFGSQDMGQLNLKLRRTARNLRADIQHEKGWFRGWGRVFSF